MINGNISKNEPIPFAMDICTFSLSYIDIPVAQNIIYKHNFCYLPSFSSLLYMFDLQVKLIGTQNEQAMSFIFPSLIASNLAQISVILSLEKCQTVLFFLFSCIPTYLTCSNKSLMTVAFISKLVQSKVSTQHFSVSDALFMGSQVFNLALFFTRPCSFFFLIFFFILLTYFFIINVILLVKKSNKRFQG